MAVRSAHRVAVAATDEVERRQLAAPARILGYEPGAEARLFADIALRPSPPPAAADRLHP